MSAFPESVWMNIDYEDGGLMEWSSRQRSSTASQYIRADIVPQWQPIETMPDRPGQVFLSTPNMCYNVGTVLDQWVFLWKTKEPVRRDSYSHWMPIPKVPE